ncbi:hypothetical protein AK812_SmicGene22735 [Symbiodinium microadriaticum]|uniref:C3H1-type domain-containing protein n=1 Tax=Symbiodinium microadriaticum TaxID=2951 RepID=A0A1Q9DJ32_SYMMI|nr:hypothetical protein AK812_SmicGene22735 [Symbiodinium microadriaticum]
MMCQGSYGHPHLCARPCVHVSKHGGCAAGHTCEFCHLPHTEAACKPDKQQRLMLSRMTDQERLATFLPHIRKKAVEIGFQERAVHLIHLLEAQLLDGSVRPSWVGRKFEKVLRRMTFGQLVSTSMYDLPEQVRRAVAQLRLQLPPPQIIAQAEGPSVFL